MDELAEKINDDKYLLEHADYSWVNNAWLGLGDTSKINVKNPILYRTLDDRENPGLHILRIMRNPEYIGFTCKFLFNVDLLPFQMAILNELWYRRFPMLIMNRGGSKTWCLGLYAWLKGVLFNNVKIVGAGAAFRQSKLIFEKMEDIWNNSDVLRSICDNHSGPRREVDRCTMHMNTSQATFLPIGSGERIRGLRASIILADEMASIPPEIYETVIAGFAAVAANPVQQVKEASRRKTMMELGIWNEAAEELYAGKTGNQAIITGTAYYSFNHFYDYWKRYTGIVKSKGDERKLKEVLGGEIPPGFNWKDYSVIRIPYELMPDKFMDQQVVARAKATVNSSVYLCEYSSCFATDSDGFFKRSLIESCVTSDLKPININGQTILFEPMLRGNPTKKYVIGVDPASEQDNFSIIVLELNSDHTRIVYCWTTTRQNFKKRQSMGMTEEHDFYKFCARKIRDLMTLFSTERIAMDSQGGGVAVSEALHDPANLKTGEHPIWEIIDPEKEKDTDHKAGLHILELCNFAKYDWVRDSNHGLRKDLEDKILLFPKFDSISLELAAEEDAERAKVLKNKFGKTMDIFDTLEDCVMEIEELKNELSTITVTVTGTGVAARERWDVPEVKLPGNKKGRMRKDRYSALLMANMTARKIHRTDMPIQYSVIGGFSKDIVGRKDKADKNKLYNGPDWFIGNSNWMNKVGLVIKK